MPYAARPTPPAIDIQRSEEHTSELQSLAYLVCRLLLEKKKDGNSPLSHRILLLRPMLTWCDNSLTSRAMQPPSCINSPVARPCCLWLGLVWAVAGHGASLQTFAVLYGQLTHDIVILEAEFDNSPEQKQTFATLVRARSVILNPELRDEQALAGLVDFFF